MGYGRDIYLINGGFQIAPNGDLLLLDEKQTLIQDVINRLKTYKGSHFAHPDYGTNIYDYIRGNGDNRTLLELINDIEEELLKDPRIWEVEVEVLERSLKGVKLLIKVQPLEDSPFNLVLTAFDEGQIDVIVQAREV